MRRTRGGGGGGPHTSWRAVRPTHFARNQPPRATPTPAPTPAPARARRCGEYDKCICYKQYGLDRPSRFAWTGPDCSQRACPLGKTFDIVDTSGPGISPVVFKPAAAAATQHLRITFSHQNRTATFKNLMRDVTFQVKVMSVSGDANVGTFAWKFDEDEFYEPESFIGDASSESKSRGLNKVNLATGAAVAEAHTGVHVWWDPYYAGSAGFAGELAAGDVYTFTLSSHGNLDFTEGDSNTAHQEAECSGRGTCNSDSGKCDCLPGFTGEACQRSEWGDRGGGGGSGGARTFGAPPHLAPSPPPPQSCASFTTHTAPRPSHEGGAPSLTHSPATVPAHSLLLRYSRPRSHVPVELLRPRRVPVGGPLRRRRRHQERRQRAVQVRVRVRRRQELRLQVRRGLPRPRVRPGRVPLGRRPDGR